MRTIVLLLTLVISGCGGVNITKSMINDYCSHSEIHRDIVMLGLTDDLFEPHSLHVHCGSEYGFPEKEG